MRIYLDNCCFNRPYDDQSQMKIKLESEAKQYIQGKIKAKEIELIWSYILDFENGANPALDKKKSIQSWEKMAVEIVDESEELLEKMESLEFVQEESNED